MSRSFKIFLFLLLGFLFLLIMGFGGMEAVFALLFGWGPFLKRTLPKISFNWDITGMAMICVVGIFFVGHSFLDRLTRHVAASRGQTWQWPRKWTYCGLIAIGLLFLVGMSVGGAVHQIGWIASSPEPMFERKPRGFEDFRAVNELQREAAAFLPADTVAAARRGLRSSQEELHRWNLRRESMLQSFHLLFVTEDSGKVIGLIFFPRDPQSKRRLGGFYTTADDHKPIPAAELPELIEKHQGHLVAF